MRNCLALDGQFDWPRAAVINVDGHLRLERPRPRVPHAHREGQNCAAVRRYAQALEMLRTEATIVCSGVGVRTENATFLVPGVVEHKLDNVFFSRLQPAKIALRVLDA